MKKLSLDSLVKPAKILLTTTAIMVSSAYFSSCTSYTCPTYAKQDSLQQNDSTFMVSQPLKTDYQLK
ncbi:MAG: hypothetical protein KC535_02260 [Nanoarchaeota archaeon]|nr:hypothetical protein [Nanoarchaeota archaeon]